MHLLAVGDVEPFGEAAGGSDPSDLPPASLTAAWPLGLPAQLTAQPSREEGAQGCTRFCGPLLGGDQQLVGNVYSRLHTGSNIGINYGSLFRLLTAPGLRT